MSVRRSELRVLVAVVVFAAGGLVWTGAGAAGGHDINVTGDAAKCDKTWGPPCFTPANGTVTSVNLGDTVTWHVFGIDNDFHAFHLHGHRWTASGEVIDNRVLAPADVHSFTIVEDNPGRWFYHCHVFSHLHMGMNGWYIVD